MELGVPENWGVSLCGTWAECRLGVRPDKDQQGMQLES